MKLSAAILTLGACAAARAGERLAALRGGEHGRPLKLVDATGSLSAAACDAVAAKAAPTLSLVASVGGKWRGRYLFNSAFGTAFDDSLGGAAAPGATIDSADAATWFLDCAAAEGAEGGSAECALAAFALGVADAVLVHSPCVAPTDAMLNNLYATLFARASERSQKITLVHVHAPGGGGADAEAAAAVAAAEAWATFGDGSTFDERFTLAFANARDTAELKAVLSALPKAHTAATLAAALTSAHASAAEGAPSPMEARERFLLIGAYSNAFTNAQTQMAKQLTPKVERQQLTELASVGDTIYAQAMDSFDAATAECFTSRDLVCKRRARLSKQLLTDLKEIFDKQLRTLLQQIFEQRQAQMLKINGRAGQVEEWQREALTKRAEATFDAALEQLLPTCLADQLPSRAQLASAFDGQLTQMATKFSDSPAMQLQALAAMKRKVGPGYKPPKGVNAGVSLVGAVRSCLGGGGGNLQSFVGYQAGLNSAHLMFANDGAVPDQNGFEPPLFRFQPKLNLEVSI